MSRPNALVGSAIPRVEDARFLTGSGRFVADLAGDGVLHAAVVRSARPHGRIRGIDATAARALPGVVAVFTAADVGSPVPRIPMRQHGVPEGEGYLQPVIAEDKVRYVGEPVALVIARDAAVAEDAVDRVTVEIESLPAVADHVRAGHDDALLFEQARTNCVTVFRARMGDADAAFAAADYTRRERLSVQRHTALPMEPRGLFAEWDAAARRLALHGATKVAFYNRRALAGMLGLDVSCVDLLEVDVGGGFGARGEIYPEDFLIPFAALRLARPRPVGRKPPRASRLHEPCARDVCRCGDRVPARRDGARRPRHASTPTSAHTCAPTV